jgi:hypothetical protein
MQPTIRPLNPWSARPLPGSEQRSGAPGGDAPWRPPRRPLRPRRSGHPAARPVLFADPAPDFKRRHCLIFGRGCTPWAAPRQVACGASPSRRNQKLWRRLCNSNGGAPRPVRLSLRDNFRQSCVSVGIRRPDSNNTCVNRQAESRQKPHRILLIGVDGRPPATCREGYFSRHRTGFSGIPGCHRRA